MQLTEMFGDSKSLVNQTQAEVNTIAHSIFANADVDIGVKQAEGELYMTVSLLRLPKADRKKGIGTAIMKELCAYADKKSIIVALSPTSEFGTGKATLMRFYKSFGFINNSGRNKNWQVRETLIRYPVVKESLFNKIVEAPWNKYDGQSSHADYDDEPASRSGDSAEQWLEKYTHQSLDKWPSAEVIQTLVDRYPYAGGTIYRGLNFADKEQWEEFLANTNNGTMMTTNGISSWSPSEKESEVFAITRPTYFLNMELMQAEDQKRKDKDYMIGHAGVVLATTIGPDVGIDVNKSKHGKEQEVILPGGEYQIKLHKTLKPFKTSITDDNYRQEFMSIKSLSMSTNEIDTQKFEHIMFHYKEFDDEMKSHLFHLITDNFKIKSGVYLDDVKHWQEDTILEINIRWNVPVAFFYYYDLLLPKDRNLIDSQLDAAIARIDDQYDAKIAEYDLTTKKFKTIVAGSLQLAIQMERVKPNFISHINNIIGNKYATLNGMKNVRRINDIKDPKAKSDAISQMAKDLEALFKQII